MLYLVQTFICPTLMSHKRFSSAEERDVITMEECDAVAVGGAAATAAAAAAAVATGPDSSRTNDKDEDARENAKESPSENTLEEPSPPLSKREIHTDTTTSQKKQRTDSLTYAAAAATTTSAANLNTTSQPPLSCPICSGHAFEQNEALNASVCFDCGVLVKENSFVDCDSGRSLQKARALQLWEQRLSQGSLDLSRFVGSINDKQLGESFKHDLNNGRVPPMFHAVVSKSKPLFRTTSHKLSSDPVMAGAMASTDTIKECILTAGDDPYAVLFTGDPPAANSRVLDEDIPLPGAWKFSAQATAAVVKLVNSKAAMLGADVEVTDNLKSALFRDKLAQKMSLLTRSRSRGVVASCFDASETDSSLAITGSPGIGKSWTLLYALQQALLYEKAIVVLMQRKPQSALLCVRLNNHVFVWRAATGQGTKVSLFENENVLVLFDPSEAKHEGADFAPGARMLIFAASNNEQHFKNGIRKVQREPERFLGLWTKGELAVALNVFNPTLTEPVALARAEEVGMLPRYVMDDAFFHDRRRQLEVALDKLEKDPSVLKQTLEFDGRNDKDVTIPGTIFAVGAALMTSGGDGDAVANDHVQDDAGYEGQFVEYKQKVLAFMSDQLPSRIASRGRKLVLEFWGKTCKEGFGVQMGHAVENLFADDLKKLASDGGQFRRWLQVEGSRIGPESNFTTTQKCAWSSKVTLDGISCVFKDGRTIGRMKKGAGLIDFVGPGRKVYQVIVALDHEKSLASFVTVLEQAGFLFKMDGSLKLATVHVPNEKLEFYWVVPSLIGESWKKKVPYMPTSAASKKAELNKQDKEFLQTCLSKYVDQFVIVLEE
jgi:hypothetical protein